MQNRRTFLQCLSALWIDGALAPRAFSASAVQTSQENPLEAALEGSWKLQSYTYASNNKTYVSPEQMEAVANFGESRYDVSFSTYISAVGIKRTRRASEAGTYSMSNDRIRLFAEEASDEDEKGEEFLTEVAIEDQTMKLTSNNGTTREVWKKTR